MLTWSSSLASSVPGILLCLFLFSPSDCSVQASIPALYREDITAAMLSWRVLGNYTITLTSKQFFLIYRIIQHTGILLPFLSLECSSSLELCYLLAKHQSWPRIWSSIVTFLTFFFCWGLSLEGIIFCKKIFCALFCSVYFWRLLSEDGSLYEEKSNWLLHWPARTLFLHYNLSKQE